MAISMVAVFNKPSKNRVWMEPEIKKEMFKEKAKD